MLDETIPKSTPEAPAEPAQPAETAPPPDVAGQEAPTATGVVPTPPPLHEYAGELRTHARKLEALVAERLVAKEDGNLSRAKNFLHEAGQWLEKAETNLRSLK